MSEIDAIFASTGKGKAKAADQPSFPPPSSPSLKKKKKSKKSKKNTQDALPAEEKPSESRKRPAPETIVDPSVEVTHKRAKVMSQADPKPKSKKAKVDQDEFRDSRGTGPRRKTEEGWGIFKEDELGIDPGAGDTPLCPFDCECCF